MDNPQARCPNCGGVHIVKNGRTAKGGQRFYCLDKSCSTKTFQLNYTYSGCWKNFTSNIPKMLSARPI